jgi:flagellar protein FliL
MAEEEEKVETATAPAPPSPPRSARLGPVLHVVNTLVLVAVLVLQVVRPGGLRHDARAEEHAAPAERPRVAEKKQDGKEALPGPTLKLADFVIHLRDSDADRYARVSFEMELPDEKAKEVVTARMPQIRDTFLAFLSDRRAEEFRGSDAIFRIKSALAQKLGEVVPSAGVRALYITELVVQ